MSKRDYIVPDEVQSAANAAHEMFGVVRKGKNFWSKQILFAAAPMLLGGLLGWLYIASADPKDLGNVKDSVVAFITVVTVLAGFVVTLMLFTGRTQGADYLNLDGTELYIKKIVYLQFSQIITLVVHMLCILVSVLWLLSLGNGLEIVRNILFSLSAALMLLSLLRTLLMPFQIFEVHFFELSVLREQKREAVRKGFE